MLEELARAGKWAEFSKAIEGGGKSAACAEILPVLEQWGDRSLAARDPYLAHKQYTAAFNCAMTVLYTSPDPEQRDRFIAPYNRLMEKLLEARHAIEQGQSADESGPLQWTTGTERVLELCSQSRDTEAHKLLLRLAKLKDTPAEDMVRFGAQLEAAADQMAAKDVKRKLWLYDAAQAPVRRAGQANGEMGQRILAKVEALDPASVPKPKPTPPDPTASNELLGELAELARSMRAFEWRARLEEVKPRPVLSSIAKYFEAEGDEAKARREWLLAASFYRLSADAREEAKSKTETIWKKLHEMQLTVVDDQVARPLTGDFTMPDLREWDQGMLLVDHLALSGRCREASHVLSAFKRGPSGNQYDRSPGRMGMIGDHLAESHPELARWFCKKYLDWVSGLPIQNITDKYSVDYAVAQAAEKLAAVEARIAHRA